MLWFHSKMINTNTQIFINTYLFALSPSWRIVWILLTEINQLNWYVFHCTFISNRDISQLLHHWTTLLLYVGNIFQFKILSPSVLYSLRVIALNVIEYLLHRWRVIVLLLIDLLNPLAHLKSELESFVFDDFLKFYVHYQVCRGNIVTPVQMAWDGVTPEYFS